MKELPAFESLLKSRDVEDPINLWVHRPLAYGFVALVYRTRITPNQVTLLATLVGLAAGACFIAGSRSAMVWGGVLLWTSAILDGADGILARVQNSGSPLGRAIDGTADAVVAVGTVLPAFYHLWVTGYGLRLAWIAPLAIGTAILHIHLYDFYKESYLMMTNPRWSGRPERISDVEALLARAKAEHASLPVLVSCHMYVGLVTAQARIVRLTNRWANREPFDFRVSDESVELYRRHNRGPMKLWALISLAPHSYSMAICAMLDRLDIYLLLRLGVCNFLFAIVMLWQRRASRRTREELEASGLGPVPKAA
jgi:phosphatidylglycerophosphate synthase